MEAQEIIKFIADAKKITPVKIYLREKSPIDFSDTNAKIFGERDKIIFGDWAELESVISANKDKIDEIVIENSSRNSAIPLYSGKD